MIKAMLPFSVFHKEAWTDVITRSSDASITRQSLQQVANDSITLFREAMFLFIDQHLKVIIKKFFLFSHFFLKEINSPNAAVDRATIGSIFSPEMYSYLLGMFEVNNNGISIPSPLQNFLHQLPSMPETERQT